MKLERAKNTKRNILVGEIDRISGVILPFIVRTMIIHMIGAEYLGLTSLFYAILQFLNLMEMGFGTAIIYSLYKPIAENNTSMINAILKFHNKAYRFAGIAVGVIGLIIMSFLPKLISGDLPSGINIYYLYLIYLVNSCLNLFIFPNRKAILAAHQRDDISGGIHIFTQLGMYIAQALAIYFTKDYYLYALMMPISSVAYSLLCARKSKKQYPQYFSEGELDTRTRKSIEKQVGGLMIRKLASMSRNAFDSMFISAYLGLTVTAIYANYYYILDAVVMVVAVIKLSMAGGVGNSIAMESKEKNRQDLHKIDFLFMWIDGWFATCLLCLYQPFMKIWVGEDMMLPIQYAVLFAAYFYLLKMSDIRTLYSESVGIWWQARYISIMEAAANLIMNWLFIKYMGLMGIIIATLISYFIFNFIGGAYILYRNYFTDGGFGKYLLYHLRYGITSALVAIITYFVIAGFELEGIAGFIITLFVCTVVSNMILYLVNFKTKIFSDSKGFIQSVLKMDNT